MYCPYCKHTDSRVVDSRTTDDGAAIRPAASVPPALVASRPLKPPQFR